MNPMPGCTTVFEPSFAWWFPALGLVGVGVGFVLARYLKGWRAAFAFLVGCLSVLWVIGATSSMWTLFADARHAAHAESTPVVEGVVRNLRPAPAEGGPRAEETFEVNGIEFAYSDYTITGGFHQTTAHGGPMREGLPVRIHYTPDDNLIVQLEVCESQ